MNDSNFISPSEAHNCYRALANGVAAAEFFNNPRHGHTQDVWCAVKFALAYEKNVGPCKVRLEPHNNDIDADFELSVDNAIYPFQTTEALEAGRRRGSEYKKPDRDPGPRSADWSPGTEQVPILVKKAITHKISKSYARVSELNLLVYMNIRAWEYNIDRIRSEVAELIIPFASVWLISSAGICTLVPHPKLGKLPYWVAAEDFE